MFNILNINSFFHTKIMINSLSENSNFSKNFNLKESTLFKLLNFHIYHLNHPNKNYKLTLGIQWSIRSYLLHYNIEILWCNKYDRTLHLLYFLNMNKLDNEYRLLKNNNFTLEMSLKQYFRDIHHRQLWWIIKIFVINNY